MKKVLVTGGLGYIGSHTVVSLVENGYRPIIIDNLSNTHPNVKQGIKEIVGKDVDFYNDELRDRRAVRRIFEDHEIWGVIHFAASKYVGESVTNPLKYYTNNIDSLCSLVSIMCDYGVKNIVFSSSCSVYGDSDEQPVRENMFRYNPATSPYGYTKQIGETMIDEFTKSYGMKSFTLRYFNPAGAHQSGLIGELPGRKESNLFPIMAESALSGENELVVFGEDYSTPDGTCLRDYIHVCDLADAHVLALKKLEEAEEGFGEILNIGTGKGTSVLECIKQFSESNSIAIEYRIGERRSGDVEKVWASTDKAKKTLGWEPKRSLEEICRSAFLWHVKCKTPKEIN